MRRLIVALALLLAGATSGARAETWQPAPGHPQIDLWPGTPPDDRPLAQAEAVTTITRSLVAGKPWRWVTDVSRPTMTIYRPARAASGVTVVVLPGGGFNGLAIDLEGTEACDWLVSRGFTAVLLKYRVPDSGPHGLREPRAPTALEDVQRAMGLLRLHAKEWRIDPHRIGLLGFSAGGYLVAAVTGRSARRLYPAIDAADRESCRPDFVVALYPGHLCASERDLSLNPAVSIGADAPPTLIVQAEDDHVDGVCQSLAYYRALKDAGAPVEMHLYAHGGHAFGLRATEQPITRWPDLVEPWLRTLGMIGPAAGAR